MFQLRGCSPPSISAVCLKQMRTRGAGMGASSHLFSSLSVCAEVGGQWWGGWGRLAYTRMPHRPLGRTVMGAGGPQDLVTTDTGRTR